MRAENQKQRHSKVSAGLLMYRLNGSALEIFLGHPGGPFFAKKNEGVWGISKGEVAADEDLLQTALREFEEETGIKPKGEYLPLGHIKQKNGKLCMPGHLQGTGIKISQSKAIPLPWSGHRIPGKNRNFRKLTRAPFLTAKLPNKK